MPLPRPAVSPDVRTRHTLPPDAVREALRGTFGALTHWNPMPSGRSNRSWLADTGAAQTVVKVFPTPEQSQALPGNPLFPNDPQDEVKALHHLADSGFAPRILGYGQSAGGAYVLYAHVPARGAAATDEIARLLSRLHGTTPPEGLRATPDGSAALDRQTLRILDLCTSGTLKQRILAARPQGEVPASGRRYFLHGDPVPGNILSTGRGLVLIDWQCPAIGDPSEDLAIFLSPSMQMAYGQPPLGDGERRRFLAAYGDADMAARYHALAPWYHWRMAAYGLWRHDRLGEEGIQAISAELAALRSVRPG